LTRPHHTAISPARNLELLVAATLLATACGDKRPAKGGTTAASESCAAEARRVAETLVQRERLVSLLAPDSAVRRELADAYGGLVTSSLLAEWQSRPELAPGRELSNPWPARIEIASMQPDSGGCRLEGEVIEVTKSDTLSPIERRHVTMRLANQGGWRVSAYESARARGVSGAPVNPTVGPPAESSPADVIRRYYAAIQAHDYASAYELWGNGGEASGETRRGFAAGFAHTARVSVTVTDSTRMGAAAGSQYATVPVRIDAVLRDGRAQHFTGTYILRRSMVDGATPEQRRWTIYKASLRERRDQSTS
jgi:hypothetical protein